ncbi:MAG: hypothetical protein H6964_13465 [Chromatiaceae bacterium]|nr:hypothetical protein [Gammaproteobacteria bacterium]MCP5447984.1 hypothetical protein [Chromatiaceae bacterium]
MLFAAGALPLLATIGFLIFLQLRRINETLRRRYLESLEQRRKLANEIVHRKAAEQELRDKQQQVLKASRELSETMAALQESQQMLSEAQRIAHVGSWNFTSRTNKLTWSDEVYRILGLEKKQLLQASSGFWVWSIQMTGSGLNAVTSRLRGATNPGRSFTELFDRMVCNG